MVKGEARERAVMMMYLGGEVGALVTTRSAEAYTMGVSFTGIVHELVFAYGLSKVLLETL